MVALAEVKMVIPQADPHNYDDEKQEYKAPKVEIPTPKVVEA